MLAGCGGIDVQRQEQARTAAEEILLLNRTAKGKQHYEPGNGGGGWKPTEMSLEIAELSANWMRPPVWRNPEYAPILLDCQPAENLWSLVATFVYCDGWDKLGRPPLPYVEYQSRNGEPWKVVPLEKRLIGRKTNLHTGRSRAENPACHRGGKRLA